jgi:hypothetical protein
MTLPRHACCDNCAYYDYHGYGEGRCSLRGRAAEPGDDCEDWVECDD